MQQREFDPPATVTVEGTAICRYYPAGNDPAALGDSGFNNILLARGRWTNAAVWVRLPASWSNSVLTLWAESDGLRAPIAQTVVDSANFRIDSGGHYFGLALQGSGLACDSWTVTAQISQTMLPGDRAGGYLSAQLWNDWQVTR